MPFMKAYKIPESVLVIIYNKDKEVLLMERADKPGFWQSVTGAKNSHEETLFDVAVREVFEETGIQIISRNHSEKYAGNEVKKSALRSWNITNTYEIYPEWRYKYAPGVTKNTEHVFGLLVPLGTPVFLAPREHVKFMWLPYLDAAKQCFSSSNAKAIYQLPEYFSQ